jgi:conjugal transfer pilus assembly protein TraF
MKNYLAILALVFVLLPDMSYAQGFFDNQRYRGWLWFENKPTNKNDVTRGKMKELYKSEQPVNNITPEEAKAEIEQFTKELEELKFMMLARPTPENVKAYRDKEKAMWTHAETLHDSWDMANLLYPEQRDLINNPVNVHGVKAKREITAQEDGVKIRNLAKQFDLVLFFDSNCRYCQLLSPVLKSFGEKYGFNIDAISKDGTKHEYFKTANVPSLIEKLGITGFPTVIAISHDSETAFELIRGYVSISELEEYSLLAIKYLQNQEIWKEQ